MEEEKRLFLLDEYVWTIRLIILVSALDIFVYLILTRIWQLRK